MNQSVEEDRKFWVQACIARIMKSLKEATYSTLIQRIHSEAANRFQELYLSMCTQKHSFLLKILPLPKGGPKFEKSLWFWGGVANVGNRE